MAGDDYTNVNAWWKYGVPKSVDEVIRRGLYKPIEIRKNQNRTLDQLNQVPVIFDG